MSFRIRNNKSFWINWKSFKMKKITSLSDNEILSFNQDQNQNQKKTGKVFQGIMSFRKTSSLSECIKLPTSLVCRHNKQNPGWEQHYNICLSFFKFSNYPVFLEQVLDPMSLSSKPGIRFAQEHQEMRRLHFCAKIKIEISCKQTNKLTISVFCFFVNKTYSIYIS